MADEGAREQKIPDKLFFKIGEVAKLTDTKPHVLRYWESEFPILRPSKGDSGQRTYRPKDVEIVFAIKRLLREENFTIAGAQKQLKKKRTEKFTGNAEKTAETEPASPTPESRGVEEKKTVDLEWVKKELGEILKILDKGE